MNEISGIFHIFLSEKSIRGSTVPLTTCSSDSENSIVLFRGTTTLSHEGRVASLISFILQRKGKGINKKKLFCHPCRKQSIFIFEWNTFIFLRKKNLLSSWKGVPLFCKKKIHLIATLGPGSELNLEMSHFYCQRRWIRTTYKWQQCLIVTT